MYSPVNRPNIFFLVLFTFITLICTKTTPPGDRSKKLTPRRLRDMTRRSEFQLNREGSKVIFFKEEYNWRDNEDSQSFQFNDITTGVTRRLNKPKDTLVRRNFQWVTESSIGFATYSEDNYLTFNLIHIDHENWVEEELIKIETDFPVLVKYNYNSDVLIYINLEEDLNTMRLLNDIPAIEKSMSARGEAFLLLSKPDDPQVSSRTKIKISELIPGSSKDITYLGLSNNGEKLVVSYLISTEPHKSKIGVINTKTRAVIISIDLISTPINNIKFSPDDDYICWIMSPDPMIKNDIDCYNFATKKQTKITENWDLSPMSIAFDRNGEHVLASAEVRGDLALFELSHGTKAPVRMTGSGYSQAVGLDRLGNVVVMSSSVYEPTELKVLTPHHDLWIPTYLTEFNSKAIVQYQMSKPEWFDFTGANDDLVHGMLINPPNFDSEKKYPMILMVRGAPRISTLDVWDEGWNYQVLAQAGYVVVDINYHGSTGYGEKFARSIMGHPIDYPYEDLIKGIHYITDKYSHIDKTKIAAWGHSYGGYIINYINGHNKDNLFKVLVSYNGIFDAKNLYYTSNEHKYGVAIMGSRPYDKINDFSNSSHSLYHKYSPSTYVRDWQTPTLVVHSKEDTTVGFGEGLATFTALQAHDVPSALIMFSKEGHVLSDPNNIYELYTQALNFTECYLV